MKMKFLNISFIVGLVLLNLNLLNAQQDPSYTLYQYNMNVVNPAYSGINDYSEVNINFRSQWINMEGNPETKSFSLGIPMNDKIGLGLSVINDKIFVLEETDLFVDFSYRVQLGEQTNLFMGLKAGGSFINIDLMTLGIRNDPVFSENVNQFNPNVGVGFLLKAKNYYLTLSSPAVLKSKRYEKDGVVVTNATDKLHGYLGGGYYVDLSDNIEFIPSIMSRYVSGAPWSLDITTTFDFHDLIELGISHRLDESTSGLVFIKMAEWFNVGYAYESTHTDVRDYSDGSHEVFMRFMF